MNTQISTQVPYRDSITEKDGNLSRPWTEFFRTVKKFLDSKENAFLTSTSADFFINSVGYSTGAWAQMTDNKVTLTPGDWVLSGCIYAGWNTTQPTWTVLQCKWSLANGNNTPVLVDILTQAGLNKSSCVLGPSDFLTLPANQVRLSITKSTDIYLVPSVNFTAAGGGYLKTFIYAERLKALAGA